MQLSVNIKVRNPEWYWSKSDVQDSKKKGAMPYDEWKLINEGKIPRHVASVGFNYNFNVESHSDNRETSFELTVYDPEPDKSGNQSEHKLLLENVTVVNFYGGNKISQVVISNVLIHQYIGAKKEHGKYYWYFFLKENVPCVRLLENIWITEESYNKIFKQFEKHGFGVEPDGNLVVHSRSGSFPIPPESVENFFEVSHDKRW